MEDDIRKFRARMMNILLARIRQMTLSQVRKIQKRMASRGCRIERQDIHPAHLFEIRKPDGPLRTSTGYIYPRPS